MDEPAARLRAGAAALGVHLSDEASANLLSLLDVFLHENRRLNLTSVDDPIAALELHVLDSLAALRLDICADGASIVDVGSGGGFPGLALAAALPRARVTLLDSAAKKVEACRRMTRRLGWSHVEAVCSRAEEASRGPLRERFDLATGRAVASLPVMMEYALPFVRAGGAAVFWKGPSVDAEGELERGAAAAKVLGGRVAKMDSFALPFSGAERRLVVAAKEAPTPDRYPRRVGIPAKRPLG